VLVRHQQSRASYLATALMTLRPSAARRKHKLSGHRQVLAGHRVIRPLPPGIRPAAACHSRVAVSSSLCDVLQFAGGEVWPAPEVARAGSEDGNEAGRSAGVDLVEADVPRRFWGDGWQLQPQAFGAVGVEHDGVVDAGLGCCWASTTMTLGAWARR
jgi:hypothetical protein